MTFRFSSLFVILGIMAVPLAGLAADADTVTPVAAPETTDSSLVINTTEVVDATTLRVLFSKPIELDTVRVTVTNQTSRENARVKEYVADPQSNAGVLVKLDSALTASTSYVLTVNTAMSQDNSTIRVGVDAIRDFVTPASFTNDTRSLGSDSTLNAANNPSAVITPTTDSEGTPTSTESGTTGSGDTTSVVAEELPETGMNAIVVLLIILVIAIPVVGIFKKRAS